METVVVVVLALPSFQPRSVFDFVGVAAFGVAAGIFYAIVYGFGLAPTKKRVHEDSSAT